MFSLKKTLGKFYTQILMTKERKVAENTERDQNTDKQPGWF